MGYKFELGVEVEDIVTGLKGIVTARVQYLNGCVQYCLVPKKENNAIVEAGYYIDQGQLRSAGLGILPQPKQPLKQAPNQPNVSEIFDDAYEAGYDTGGPATNKPRGIGR